MNVYSVAFTDKTAAECLRILSFLMALVLNSAGGKALLAMQVT